MEKSLASLLESASQGDAESASVLFASLYSELHRIARRELARNRGGGTLGATTLLHEAYLNMSGKDASLFPDRGRFMGYAARVMRGLIIDYARRRQAIKRGGRFEITSIGDDDVAAADVGELTAVSNALDELATVEPVLAETVDLKFFCGFSFSEIAAMRGVSERTIQRNWEKARLYLFQALGGSAPV